MKTFKRISAILLAAILLFSGIPMAELGIESIFATKASAISVVDGILLRDGDKLYGDFVYNYVDSDSKNEIKIKRYMGYDKNITVPDFIEGLPVTELSAYSFSPNSINTYSNPECLYIESVILPDTVRDIKNNTFYGCKNLQKLEMPEELETIGTEAFKDCVSLKEIDLSHGVNAIYTDAFYGTKIKKLIISSDNKYLDLNSYALRGSSVKNLTIKTPYTYICQYSLETETLNTLTIDSSVIQFDKLAFGDVETAYLPEEINIYDDFTTEVYYSLEKYYSYVSDVSEENDLWWTFTKAKTKRELHKIDGFHYYLNKKGEAVLESCNGSGNVVIPEKVGGATVTTIYWDFFNNAETIALPDTVTHIQSGAFYADKSLLSISFGSGLKSIGYGAFVDCINLTSIKLPESVVKIPSYAFENCHKLKSIDAPGVIAIEEEAFSGCSKLCETKFSDDFYYVGDYAFANCYSLISFEYDNCVTYIGEYAFSDSNIETFEFNDKLTEISSHAFYNTPLKTVNFPSKLEKIDSYAFYRCEDLEEITIPNTVRVINRCAFAFCTSLNGELAISENIVKLGSYAFSNTGYTTLNYNSASFYSGGAFSDTKLATVNLGNNVKIIPSKMFYGCTDLKAVSLPNSVTKIGSEAFAKCTSLESITMSDSITEIEKKVFDGCTKLTEITIPKSVTKLDTAVFTSNLTTVYYNAENCTFTGLSQHTAKGTYCTPFYKTNIKNVIIGDTVKRIPNYFFCNADFIDNIALPDSVTEIGKDAFRLSTVKNISFPANLIVIEDCAFSETQVSINGGTFPDGMRMIGKEAFSYCNNLEEIYIPDSVVHISEYAFENCKKLSKVRMSPNVNLISRSCFINCSLLREFIWDSDVKLISDFAFYNCKLLSEFDFTGVELLYPNSFTYTGVTVVALGENKNEEATGLIVVEEQSFKNCADLETLSIGGNVATIKSEAFADCSNLEVAVISNSVINIASDAFDGCNSLTIYCMENSYAHDYAVQNNIPVSTFVIAPIPNQTYTGNRIEPELDVSVSNKQLTENTDFTVKYADNINVGTAKVTVSGKGIYKVLTSIANFTIITKNIAPVTIAPVADQNYTGEAVTPPLTVTDGSNILREGTDYTVTYKNNVNTGTATATIQGIGNYSGTASVSFTILEQTFLEKMLSAISTFFTTIITWLQALFGFIIK